MATFHLHTKPISRKGGRSATASSAYRAGVKIEDKRTGLIHDFSKRSGVVTSDCFMYQNGEKVTLDRSEVWNIAEQHEKRKDSRTAREIVINLPHELNEKQRHELVKEFTESIAKKYNVAVDYAIHLPDKEGDQRNHHSHILMTTRTAELNENNQLTLGDKTAIELGNKDLKKLGLPTSQEQITELRAEWAETTNRHLELAGVAERIDHRSFEEQGKDQLPTIKMGWKSTEAERKGIPTIRGEINRQIRATNESIRELKLEITADNMRLDNYVTLETIDNKAVSDTVRQNLAKNDFAKLQQFASFSKIRLEEINDKAEIEPLSPDDIERYNTAKGIAKAIEEMRVTGVWEQKALQSKENQKQSEVTAVTEPLQQTHVKPPIERLEKQQETKGRVVPPPPKKTLQSENKGFSVDKFPNLSEKDKIKLKFFSETAKAMYADNPEKLEQTLAQLDTIADKVERGEMQMPEVNLERKNTPQMNIQTPTPSKNKGFER